MPIKVKVKLKKRSNSKPNIDVIKEKYSFYKPETDTNIRDSFSFMKRSEVSSLSMALDLFGIRENYFDILRRNKNGRTSKRRSTAYGDNDPRRVLEPIRSTEKGKGLSQSEENTLLLGWAKERGKLNAQSVFMDRWHTQTEVMGKPIKGQEHLVIFNGKYVEKARYLWPQDSWKDVLNAYDKHNAYFPGTVYKFENFSEPHKVGLPLMAIYTQPAIKGEPADYSDVSQLMLNKGFIPVRHVPSNVSGLDDSLAIKWWNPINNDIISDLGPRNVLNVNGKLAFIDPNIDTVENVPGLRERIVSTVGRNQIITALDNQASNGLMAKSLDLKQDNYDGLGIDTIVNDVLQTYEKFYSSQPESMEKYKLMSEVLLEA